VYIKTKELQINEEIRAKEIRVIGADNEQLGILTVKDALNVASESSLDLVNIAPNAEPPVCRIMDYGKYKFELAKKERDARKKQKVINIKEVRISPNIEENDLNTKIKSAKKFLEAGDKVKVTVRFRGREVNYSKAGNILLTQFAEAIKELSTIEKEAKMEGRNMTMVLAPMSSK
jgi:translation initiation factor IF-3